jgi:hypothetical protein
VRNIWNELTQTADKVEGYDLMIGNAGDMISTTAGNTGTTPEYTVYVPLQFWFCRNPGLA